MNNFISGIAVILSAIALAFSGFTTYQLFDQQKQSSKLEIKFDKLENSVKNLAANSNSDTIPENTNSIQTPSQSSQVTSEITATNSKNNRLTQLVQYAFKDKAKVEILSLKRIQDPETQMRDVVNLQMRIRLVKECDVSYQCTDNISLPGTKARNFETSEVYESYGPQRSTGIVPLFTIKKGSSVDTYVWLKIPEEVKAVDILVPDTAAFEKVPITN